MPTIDRLREVMERLGPVDDEIIAIVEIDDATWVVRYENLDVEVALDRAGVPSPCRSTPASSRPRTGARSTRR